MRRLAVSKPDSLYALLQFERDGVHIPWVKQALDDMERLREISAEVAATLPPPAAGAKSWLEFMQQEPELWDRYVAQCTFAGSVLDTVANSTCTPVGAHVCTLCSAPRPAFSSAKALASHQRTRHAVRNPMRAFADASAVCQCCGNYYGTRLRLLAHLSDSRRDK